MSETPTVEQVMERIRAQLRQQQGSATPSRPAANAPRSSRPAAAPLANPPSALALQQDISRLHAEVSAALDGHLQTGQLNPRPPGLHNDVLQFSKKVIRRSLTWYTRPLHKFQASVVRALEHATNLLQKQGKALLNESAQIQQLTEQVRKHSDALSQLQSRADALSQLQNAVRNNSQQIEEQAESLRATREQVQQHSDALRETSEQLKSQSAAIQQTAERLLSHWVEHIQPLRDQLIRVDEKHDDVSQKLRESLQFEVDNSARQVSRVDVLQAQLSALQEELRLANAMTRSKDRDFRRVLHGLGSGEIAPPQSAAASTTLPPAPPMFPSEMRSEGEFDYFLFEEQYRGSEAEIRARQYAYLDLFRGRADVVDIGCGRGEFLEMLRDNNVTARGVELGTDQYLLCREKGLNVVQQDLFTFLESQPDASLGGLFSAQVVEHMTASDQLRLVSLAYQKCSSQSPVVFETINPECVYALLHNFFLDPTHVRPAHPGMLKFAMESRGFRDVQLRFASPVADRHIPRLTLADDPESLQRFNHAMEQVNRLLYGHQDYAAIGWK
jgi:O-antigen chain-terminating methyltransferase